MVNTNNQVEKSPAAKFLRKRDRSIHAAMERKPCIPAAKWYQDELNLMRFFLTIFFYEVPFRKNLCRRTYLAGYLFVIYLSAILFKIYPVMCACNCKIN